jgi:uncharacterized Zn-binding protein involved in type VI secretion
MAIIGFIVLGDRTSHGGAVISADPTWTIDNQPVARVGDKASCPRCKRTVTIVTSRFQMMIDMGQAAAFDQDRTDCGALLYSRHNGHAGHDDGLGDTAATSAASPATVGAAAAEEPYSSKTAPRFEEHFVLRDSATGEPLKGWLYSVITADGRQIEGETDQQGRTQVVWTDSPEPVQITARPPARPDDDPYHFAEGSYSGL